MEDRKAILLQIFKRKDRLDILKKKIDTFDWDFEYPLLVIKEVDMQHELLRFITEEVSFSEIEEWANILEGREDINFESEKIEQIIYELANPIINQKITYELLKSMLNELTDNVS